MKEPFTALQQVFLFPVAFGAPTELTIWDFLGGGDHLRNKRIAEELNCSQG
jgi:hypothetical protein